MFLTRRQLMLSSLAAPLAGQRRTAPPPVKPNVVLVIADDLAAWMLGCYGNREFKTPNIDMLAAMGVRFSSHHVATPVCSPSRATLFTGRAPRQHGIHDFLTPDPVASPPQGQQEPPPSFAEEVMISDLLSQNGYRCGYVGKWHMGGDEKPQHGYEYWHTSLTPNRYRNPRMSFQGDVREEPGYLAEIVTDSGLAFLDKQTSDKPFFLVLSYLNPHTPYDGHPEKYYKLYENELFEEVGYEDPAPNALREKNMLTDIVGNLRKCAAAVTALDDQVGVLIRKLDAKGLRENTLIVFTGDNGYLLGRHGLWSKGLASDPVNMYEEVMQVPMIYSWLGKTPPAIARPELVSFYDFLPTLCALTLTAPPAGRNLPGKSYAGFVLGQAGRDQRPAEYVFGHFRNTEMAKDRRYKLVLRDEGKGPGELYDLQRDPRERSNQYDNPQFLEVRQRLTKAIEGWRRKYSA